jgi:hypothetical protein
MRVCGRLPGTASDRADSNPETELALVNSSCAGLPPPAEPVPTAARVQRGGLRPRRRRAQGELPNIMC